MVKRQRKGAEALSHRAFLNASMLGLLPRDPTEADI
jgi:hypothetical protein